MFGATRTPEASGSPGMMMAAFTGSAISVARNAIGRTRHSPCGRSARASLRSVWMDLRFMA